MNIIARSFICIPFIWGVANAQLSQNKLIDKVVLNLTAQEWVKTTSAKIEVVINATLTQQSLAQVRQDIYNHLNSIAKGTWHITQFSRSQNSSGLETVTVSASARVEQSLLVNIDKRAKSISKPGTLYRINNVDFNPSSKDIQAVEPLVRHKLYEKINKEIKFLNHNFKNQSYSLYRVTFLTAEQARQNNKFKNSRQNMAYAAMSPSAVSISVDNKLVLNAFVVLASNRNIENKK